MFSQVSVILSTIGLMATRSLIILVTVRSVRILLECYLVLEAFFIRKVSSNAVKYFILYIAGRIVESICRDYQGKNLL